MSEFDINFNSKKLENLIGETIYYAGDKWIAKEIIENYLVIEKEYQGQISAYLLEYYNFFLPKCYDEYARIIN